MGWNATQDGRDFLPTFPNARYLLPQKDWRHYNQAEQREKTPYLDGTRLLYRLGKVELVDGEKAVTLRGDNIAQEFHALVENYIEKRFGAKATAA